MTVWERHLADRVQQLESALVRARHERDRQHARAENWRHRALNKPKGRADQESKKNERLGA